MSANSITGIGQGSALGVSRGGDSTSIGVEKLIGKIKADQLDLSTLSIPIERRLKVSNTTSADFTTIQGAIDSITDASVTKKYIIELITTDTFEENVTLKDHVHLTHVGYGPNKTATITSSSGITLTMPNQNCSISGFYVESTSANPSDAAIKTTDSVVPFEFFGILKEIAAFGKNGAIGIWHETFIYGEVIMFNTSFGSNGGTGLVVDSGVVPLINCGLSINTSVIFPKTSIKATGAFVIIDQCTFLNDPADTGYILDSIGSTLVVRSLLVFGASNIINLTSGSTGLFLSLLSAASPSATPVTVDATSILMYANFSPDGLGIPVGFGGTGWSINPSAVILPLFNLNWSAGTIFGPDQRLTATGVTPPAGTTFFATDAAMGGGPGSGVLLYYIPGTGWIDFSGAIHV